MGHLSGITTRELTRNDTAVLEQALALLNRTQGMGLFAPDYLTKRLGNPDQLVLAAFADEKFVGIAVAELIDNFDYYLPFDSNIAVELTGKIVGSFTTLSTLEGYQGKGVGQVLSRRRIEWLASKRCQTAVGVSWVSGLAHTSNRTFERAGFRAVRRLDDFYVASSLKEPFDCPGCRKLLCACGAIFYRRDFA